MKFIYLILLALLYSVPASADLSTDLKNCSVISDSLTRLKCYDGLSSKYSKIGGIESQQIQACIEDIKLGLNDPDSLKMTSSRGFDIDNGWYRMEIKYTAKNALGGRVRGDSICGFKTKKSTKLNEEDFMNKNRKLVRDLKSLGITY